MERRIDRASGTISLPPLGTAAVLLGLGLLASGCGGGALASTSRPAATTASSSSAPPAESARTHTSAPSSPAVADAWTGPIRGPGAASASIGSNATPDGDSEHGDAPRDYVDITRVSSDSGSQPHWRLHLAAAPPKAATLDRAQTVISYGLAFETTGDDEPDYVVGISNEAPGEGHFRVWVTDVAAGTTEEQVGPPYGFPVEFAHPDEQSDEQAGDTAMVFTFLGGSRPPGIGGDTRFYAWASVTEDGEVAAWDYAPDAGWIGDARAALAPEDPPAEPIQVAPNAPGGFPECQAEAFDFAGEGTLRGLGLDKATPVPPPDPDRPAMIWVTRDLMPREFGEPGGPVQMTRMLCFEFADGSGGSGWPVDPAWRPPGDAVVASTDAPVNGVPPELLLGLLVAVLVAGLSALAFRRGR